MMEPPKMTSAPAQPPAAMTSTTQQINPAEEEIARGKAQRDKEIRASVEQIMQGIMAALSYQAPIPQPILHIVNSYNESQHPRELDLSINYPELMKEMESKLSASREQSEKSNRDEEELVRTLNHMIKEQCNHFHWNA